MSWSRWTGAAAAALLLGAGIAVTAPAEAATAPVTTGIGRTLGGEGHSFSVPAGYPGGSLVRAWSHTFSGTLATPLVIGSAVVAATTGTAAGSTWADLQAFDGATGTALWPPVAIGTEVSSLASDGQRVFAVSGQSVLGVDLATGRVLWDRKVSGVLFRTEVPTVYGGLLWVNDDDRTLGLTALDPATGAVVHAYPNDGTGATMALVGHTLYDSSCAIDLPSGTRLTGGS